jgi:XapX domain-containing protein
MPRRDQPGLTGSEPTGGCSPRPLGDNIMKTYLLSLILGIAVGLIYQFVGVKSPAPPTVALVGLLGMLAGEHAITFVRALLTHVAS